MTPAPAATLVPEAALTAALARAEAERWQVSRDSVADALTRSVRARFGDTSPAPDAVTTYVASLHAPDVALACACAAGHDAAWDHFVLTYRPELYRAARALTDEGTARELADTLYADLFGLSERDGVRRSLFRYYHGRAKLGTWLRSVLAQRHVDVVRARRRTTSLDDPEQPADTLLPARPPEDVSRAQAMRVAATAVTAALALLAAGDRVRLAYYYAHGLTLAQCGRLLGESEATVSRKLDKVRRQLRSGIEQALRERGLQIADLDDWVAVARDAWDVALVEALGVPAPQELAPKGPAPQEPAPPPFKGQTP